ncbi:MAG: RHS repeat-associated core domain-containing protein, partial [Anaerolineae bacterium]|nr:RHS repeat-associated core domain-containing protein [Anaerolineae bacterium]
WFIQGSSPGNMVPGTETRYLPYGTHRLAPTTQLTERDYTGQKENLELGLLYYNARFYLPKIGRFLTADIIVPNQSDPQSANRYTYVLGNPVRYEDPTGHCIEVISLALCFVGGMTAVVAAVHVISGWFGSDVDYAETTEKNIAVFSTIAQYGNIAISNEEVFHYPSGQAQHMACSSICGSNPSFGLSNTLAIGSTDFTSSNDTPADAWSGHSISMGFSLSGSVLSGSLGTSTTYCPNGCNTAETKATTVNTYSLGLTASLPIPITPYLCESSCVPNGSSYPMQNSPNFSVVDAAVRGTLPLPSVQNEQNKVPYTFIRRAGH